MKETEYADAPWITVGHRLDGAMTAAEAFEQSGLNFAVELKPLRAVVSPRQSLPVDNAFATVRTDSNQVLGIVGRKYFPLQNDQALSFFDVLVDRREAIYHTAGLIQNGSKTWLLAKLPGYLRIGPSRDPIEKYVLLYNSHDGSSNVRCKLTSIRVSCSNTLSVALNGSDQEVKIRHTASATEKLATASSLLGITNHLYEQLGLIFNNMAERRATPKKIQEFLHELVPDNDDAESKTRTRNIRDSILQIHNTDPLSVQHRNTVFGLVNSVSEYYDHSPHNDAMKHLRSIWFNGNAEKQKIRAFQIAESML